MSEKLEPKPCPFALGHLNHQLLQSRISACFRCTEKLGDYRTDKMSEAMNSEAARQHRKTLMSGKWPEGCGSCRDYESKGQPSTRKHGFVHADLDKMISEYDPETGAIKQLRSIEIRFGNECNLTCRHCFTAHSSRWEAIVRRDPSLTRKLHRVAEEKESNTTEGYFEDIVTNIVPGIKEIMFSGGEVLYQKAHYKFVDSIPENYAGNIELVYVTNGTIRSLDNWDLTDIWHRFKNVTIVVSTDGVGDRFEYFRVGAKWQDVENNIRYWRRQGFLVNTEITCSVYQVFYLIESLNYLYETKLSDGISTSLVQYPPVLNPRIIRPDIKTKLKTEWDLYIAGITDPKKLEVFQRAGQHIIDFMMGENMDAYEIPDGRRDSWKNFEMVAKTTDELFKTDIAQAFPRIAEVFATSDQHKNPSHAF